MVTIRITRKFDSSCVAELNVTDRLSIVLGDSATGKTHICSMMEEREDSAFEVKAVNSDGNDVPVYYCATLARFDEIVSVMKKVNSVIVIDEYVTTQLLRDNLKSGLLNTVSNYFIVFHRDATVKFNVGVNSVFKVDYTDHVYRFQKAINFSVESNIERMKQCDLMLIEDKKSGFIIMKHYFETPNKMKVDTTSGNGKIEDKILSAYNNGHNIIVGLDFDMGANMAYNFRDMVLRGEFGKDSVFLINMECIEEIICNSELIISGCTHMLELVKNMEKYIDCTFRHRGDYFLELLKRYFVVLDPNNPDKEPRSLYVKRNGGCFTRNCKDCRQSNCNFRNDEVDKAELTFSNKYKMLYDLYSYLKNNN